VKSCKIPAYTRKMKELISKITETSTVIAERRQAATLNLQDLNAVVCDLSLSAAPSLIFRLSSELKYFTHIYTFV